MHPLAILILAAAGSAAVHANPPAGGNVAARFWERTLPGTPMPEVIADLVQKGIDHPPLLKHHPRSWMTKRTIWTVVYNIDTSHADKNEVPPGLFFRMSQVRVGGTMTISFPPAVVPAILPRDVAEKVPFSNLEDVLSVFNITRSSVEAAMVNDTLSRCEAPDHAGEQKACATSLETTVQTAVRMLGTNSQRQQVWAVASKGLPASGALPLQSYVMEAIRPLDGNRHVGCHIVPYPYAVYHCHTTGQPTKAFVVSLRGIREQGPGIQLASICHLNTSNWNPTYPAFEILHTRPGGTPVCHFMGYANLVFGKKAAKT